ncbi:hypothetical protein C8J56DRAFT_1024176 [Mycena floridula]|nr:hypothetical protein C8J56DRAFT_1024176 [Mycena floridula]
MDETSSDSALLCTVNVEDRRNEQSVKKNRYLVSGIPWHNAVNGVDYVKTEAFLENLKRQRVFRGPEKPIRVYCLSEAGSEFQQTLFIGSSSFLAYSSKEAMPVCSEYVGIYESPFPLFIDLDEDEIIDPEGAEAVASVAFRALAINRHDRETEAQNGANTDIGPGLARAPRAPVPSGAESQVAASTVRVNKVPGQSSSNDIRASKRRKTTPTTVLASELRSLTEETDEARKGHSRARSDKTAITAPITQHKQVDPAPKSHKGTSVPSSSVNAIEAAQKMRCKGFQGYERPARGRLRFPQTRIMSSPTTSQRLVEKDWLPQMNLLVPEKRQRASFASRAVVPPQNRLIEPVALTNTSAMSPRAEDTSVTRNQISTESRRLARIVPTVSVVRPKRPAPIERNPFLPVPVAIGNQPKKRQRTDGPMTNSTAPSAGSSSHSSPPEKGDPPMSASSTSVAEVSRAWLINEAKFRPGWDNLIASHGSVRPNPEIVQNWKFIVDFHKEYKDKIDSDTKGPITTALLNAALGIQQKRLRGAREGHRLVLLLGPGGDDEDPEVVERLASVTTPPVGVKDLLAFLVEKEQALHESSTEK